MSALQDLPTSADERPAPNADELFIGGEMPLWKHLANAVMLAGLVTVAVAVVWVMSSLPRIDGQVPVHGLELPAKVARDSIGVPTITARSVRDGYFSIGWVHAQDRIWQMEWQRRIGAGRLAELVGAPAVETDKFMRTLGLYRLAEASFERLDKPTRDALIAYAEGVNAWIDAHRHRLPPEFLLLGTKPEPWRPADSLVWQRMMAMQLAGDWKDDLLRAKLATRLEAKRLNELWPGTADGPITLSAATAQSLLALIPEAARPRQASNAWVLSGSLTESGKPLLANDPHLPFQAPSLWYLLTVEAPGLMVSGGTVPGVPFHLVGHNGRIAWGMTTTHADTVDLVIEKPSADGQSYQVGKQARPFLRRDETIRVKDAADVTMTVRETQHGPIISDLIGGARPDQMVALRATALEANDLTAQAFFKMGRAVDWRGFTQALGDLHSPALNVMYGDVEGNIGFMTAGRIPRRKSGDGTMPAEGWSDRGDWIGWIPFDKLPQSLNPKAKRLINANNQVVGPRYPFLITAHWPIGARAERIDQLLQDRKALTTFDMSAIQADLVSLPALELRDLLGSPTTADPRANEALRLLAEWNGRMEPDRPEPLILNAWIEEVWRGLFADELGEDFAHFRAVRPFVLIDALTRHRHWCDDVTTAKAESCDEQVQNALDRAMARLSGQYGASVVSWRWGSAHRAVFDHPILSAVPMLSRLGRTEIETGGDDFTVNRGTFAPGRFQHVHGAGLRAVFDLSNLSASTFVVAVGQAGNPLSRHYDDQALAWRSGNGFAIGQHLDHMATLELVPSY
ncbi:putative Acyl-homoserine lactone acylase quiP [Magnetospirillum sp. LM-5]|uniref:penicillin acylase family protein n=1 Tax=Magnetospirillum sp. LM-5 TaxID=2681466 RepID=UPI0013822A97|nr:penicillin acylase family protein [Magnetospirillum sp. LM-5]CAA7613937.1 putative Acyl-homoserine lactone acylase quiP [Magnetospirillum sp. LM-5]